MMNRFQSIPKLLLVSALFVSFTVAQAGRKSRMKRAEAAMQATPVLLPATVATVGDAEDQTPASAPAVARDAGSSEGVITAAAAAAEVEKLVAERLAAVSVTAAAPVLDGVITRANELALAEDWYRLQCHLDANESPELLTWMDDDNYSLTPPTLYSNIRRSIGKNQEVGLFFNSARSKMHREEIVVIMQMIVKHLALITADVMACFAGRPKKELFDTYRIVRDNYQYWYNNYIQARKYQVDYAALIASVQADVSEMMSGTTLELHYAPVWIEYAQWHKKLGLFPISQKIVFGTPLPEEIDGHKLNPHIRQSNKEFRGMAMLEVLTTFARYTSWDEFFKKGITDNVPETIKEALKPAAERDVAV